MYLPDTVAYMTIISDISGSFMASGTGSGSASDKSLSTLSEIRHHQKNIIC